jgi:hypothetical protein
VGNLNGYREEIWAYGLRNPWRFSFDPLAGQLWAGDVGQGSREEVDLIEKGNNYGWNIMEGFACYNPPSGCNQTGLTLPVKDYTHSVGISITGGYVYRGLARPELNGAYVYADYGSGRIWMLRYDGSNLTADSLLLQAPFTISSFGTDQQNELYVVGYSTGNIYRFNRSVPVGIFPELPKPIAFSLEQNFPNPFNPATTIRYILPARATIRLEVFDLLGQSVRLLSAGEESPGVHQVRFEAGNLPSGIYIYRLHAVPAEPGGGFFSTRKFVLLR